MVFQLFHCKINHINHYIGCKLCEFVKNLEILRKSCYVIKLRNDWVKKNYKLHHHDHKVDRNRMSYCFRSKIFFIKCVRARRTVVQSVQDRRTRSVNYVIVTVPLTLSGLKPQMVPTNEKMTHILWLIDLPHCHRHYDWCKPRGMWNSLWLDDRMTDMSPLVVDHYESKSVSLRNNRIYTNHSKQYFYIEFQHLLRYHHIQLKKG